MLTFDEPSFLLLLVLLTPLVYFSHFWKKRGGLLSFPLSQWGAPRLRVHLPVTNLIRFFGALFFWASLVLLILTLSGPGWATRQRLHLNPGADILLVLDESPSMAAQDFKPDNRFSVAIRVLEKFIRGRENDSLGLVTFAREAALRVPLTLDYSFLLDALKKLHIGELGDGTAIGMGLATAALHLSHSLATQKVVILLTDGVNNAGEIQPETAADMLRTLDVRLYVIGIGSLQRVSVDFEDPKSGSIILGSLENSFQEGFLKTLAERKGGVYFSAGSPGALDSIFQSIDTRESGAKRVKVVVSTHLLYREILWVAVFLLLFSFFLRRVILGESL